MFFFFLGHDIFIAYKSVDVLNKGANLLDQARAFLICSRLVAARLSLSMSNICAVQVHKRHGTCGLACEP